MIRMLWFAVAVCLQLSGCTRASPRGTVCYTLARREGFVQIPSDPTVQYLGYRYGNAFDEDFKTVDRLAITPENALEVAQPYLDESYSIRYENVKTGDGFSRPVNGVFLSEHIVLKGDWYNVCREYISPDDGKNKIPPEWFLPFAVRVNGVTGAVIPPDRPEERNRQGL